jgi:hypothetical protein
MGEGDAVSALTVIARNSKKRFALNKRALLLTAASFALLSSWPAHAATCAGNATTSTLCDINTAITTNIATSTVQTAASDITIEGTGAITVTTTTAALKIDSDNNVINNGAISNKNTSGAIGVEINAGHGSATTTVATYNGALFEGTGTTTASIDLSGTGTGKTGLLLDTPTLLGTGTIDATATTPADVTAGIAPGINVGTMNVVGDSSYGVHMMQGVTLDGPLNIDGAISVKSSTTTAGTPTNVTGVEVDGNIAGNLNIGATLLGGSISAAGAGSRGLVVLGSIQGSIYNGGTIVASGTSTAPTTTTGNPQGGTAVEIAGSVSQGIYNQGPITSSDANSGLNPAATIATQGTGPALLISSSSGFVPGELDVGLYVKPDGSAPDDAGYDFYNRGQISAQPSNVDTGSLAVHIVGAAGAPVVFKGGTIGSDLVDVYLGGLLNSGAIASSASTDTNASGVTVSTALWIDNYVTIPVLTNTSEVGAGHGNITATISGASSGQAIAILINCGNGVSCNAGDGFGTVNKLYNSGTIQATATSTDTKTALLTAIAIDDKSGTLSYINNTGTIKALACATAACVKLDSPGVQSNIAASLQANTTGVDFENSGSVQGDILFGSGDDTLNVTGTNATVVGNISFWGGHDTLNVGDSDVVAGAVLERGGGYVNVTVGTTVGGTGSLFINNTDFASPTTTTTNYDNGTMQVGSLDVKSGGTLGISLSQGFNQAVTPSNPELVKSVGGTGLIHLENGAKLDISFGSFVSTPGNATAKFVLFDAPTITIDNSTDITTSVEASIPFLFTGASTGILCGYSVAGFSSCGGTTPTDAQLVINLTTKSAADLHLSGYAKQIFSFANVALANDNTLGAHVVQAGSGLTTSAPDVATGDQLYQDLYAQFAPDVSGGARAIAVSLTDQATSVLGAHQRALRMYAGKESAATLWGQEFVQRFDNGTNLPNGFRDSGFGFALGADGGAPSAGRYGGAFTFFSGDILEKTPAQVKTSTEWYMLSGYTDWRGKGLFFDSQVTLGYGSLTGRRSMFVENKDNNIILARAATDRRASLMAAGGFSTGTVMNWGTLVFMPQFSMDALTLRENGYTETGGGDGFDLSVDPYYAKSLRAYVGSSFREDLNVGGFYLQPEARIGYRYDLLADPVQINARFAADKLNSIPAGSTFSLTGPDPGKGNLVLGAGLAATTANWSLGISYDLVSGSGYTQHTGTFTLIGRL